MLICLSSSIIVAISHSVEVNRLFHVKSWHYDILCIFRHSHASLCLVVSILRVLMLPATTAPMLSYVVFAFLERVVLVVGLIHLALLLLHVFVAELDLPQVVVALCVHVGVVLLLPGRQLSC